MAGSSPDKAVDTLARSAADSTPSADRSSESERLSTSELIEETLQPMGDVGLAFETPQPVVWFMDHSPRKKKLVCGLYPPVSLAWFARTFFLDFKKGEKSLLSARMQTKKL